jgi:hypothetical protein
MKTEQPKTIEELRWQTHSDAALIADLLKDKKRLDWILANCAVKKRDLGWIRDSRDEIDEAMEMEANRG